MLNYIFRRERKMIRKAVNIIILVMILTILYPVMNPGENTNSSDKTTWVEKQAPNYVQIIGKAKVTKKPKAGVIKYSKLDKYGRAGKVTGNITYKLMEKSIGWREDINEDPSGWPRKNGRASIQLYNGRTYNGWFWNRSHLIADSLGGKPIRENLITGTRMQNVGANDGKGGMAYTERKAVAWLNKHKKGSVYYSAKPVYKGTEPIPRTVIVDIKTSDGTINQRVIVYNSAKGYKINYRTGEYTDIKKRSVGNGSIKKQIKKAVRKIAYAIIQEIDKI